VHKCWQVCSDGLIDTCTYADKCFMLCSNGYINAHILHACMCSNVQAVQQGLEAGRDSIKERVQKEKSLNEAVAVQVRTGSSLNHCSHPCQPWEACTQACQPLCAGLRTASKHCMCMSTLTPMFAHTRPANALGSRPWRVAFRACTVGRV